MVSNFENHETISEELGLDPSLVPSYIFKPVLPAVSIVCFCSGFLEEGALARHYKSRFRCHNTRGDASGNQ